MAFTLPEVEDEVGVAARAVTEGLVLGAYSFRDFKKADDSQRHIEAATIAIGDGDLSVARRGAAVGRVVADAVCFARDLVNTPGGSLTPTVFAERAAERAAAAGLTVEVLEKDEITSLGLGGLLAVNQGSTEPPRLREADVRTRRAGAVMTPSRWSARASRSTRAACRIKPADGMMTMKSDMAGAAAVDRRHVRPARPRRPNPGGVVHADDRQHDRRSSPSDPATSTPRRNGTTVEVLNTDAEGRLVLADALALAVEESARRHRRPGHADRCVHGRAR